MQNNETRIKFENWVMKIQFDFLENQLFQPIGLELSCTPIILETADEYILAGVKESKIAAELYPLAFYKPDTDSIHIFIEHECFIKRKSDKEKYAFLMFLLFHEANHRLLLHSKRRGEKDLNLWNIAADMEIHNTLYVYWQIMKDDPAMVYSSVFSNMKDYISKFLFDKANSNFNEGLFDIAYIQNVAEEIYLDLMESKEEEQMQIEVGCSRDPGDDESESDDGQVATVTTTKYTSKAGKHFSYTTVEFPNEDEDDIQGDDSALTRKTLMESNLQKHIKEFTERNRGTAANACATFIKKLFHVKINWKSILRSSLQTALEKSEYFSWAKPRTSLFALPGSLYLPVQCEDEEKYGTLIIARDESGSMTNEEISQAASIILEAKEFYKKIILIKHDTEITSVEEFEEIDDQVKRSLMTRNSNGGTSHQAVFKWINAYDTDESHEDRISCCIFITDLCSDIQGCQQTVRDDLPKIYIYPKDAERFWGNRGPGISGKLIPIEL